jgi:2-polyprenyl-6-methoxyphenol hydroxylase-like FAD-dependent oxidoreductase
MCPLIIHDASDRIAESLQRGNMMVDATIIIVGAGPVGMLAALIASQRGLQVLLIERLRERQVNSRAIGITPPSLEILKTFGLDTKLIGCGVRVVRSEAHSKNKCLGSINFGGLSGEYGFILAVPQDKTESIFEEALASTNKVRVIRGHEVTGVTEKDGIVIAEGVKDNGTPFRFSSDYLVACDGGKSAVRRSLGIPFDGHAYSHTFLMGDFDDTTGWGKEARLFFTSRGSVESFPLPGNKRRYVLRTPQLIKAYTSDYLEIELLLRACIDVKVARKYWESGFEVGRFIARRFCEGHVFLCGDSAHLMSPIGGQNMNTGFADAELAVWLVDRHRSGGLDLETACSFYNRMRKRAARSAAWRAGVMMRIGTSGGRIWSAIRNSVVYFLLRTPLTLLLISMFTMLSIPGRNISSFGTNCKKELGV